MVRGSRGPPPRGQVCGLQEVFEDRRRLEDVDPRNAFTRAEREKARQRGAHGLREAPEAVRRFDGERGAAGGFSGNRFIGRRVEGSAAGRRRIAPEVGRGPGFGPGRLEPHAGGGDVGEVEALEPDAVGRRSLRRRAERGRDGAGKALREARGARELIGKARDEPLGDGRGPGLGVRESDRLREHVGELLDLDEDAGGGGAPEFALRLRVRPPGHPHAAQLRPGDEVVLRGADAQRSALERPQVPQRPGEPRGREAFVHVLAPRIEVKPREVGHTAQVHGRLKGILLRDRAGRRILGRIGHEGRKGGFERPAAGPRIARRGEFRDQPLVDHALLNEPHVDREERHLRRGNGLRRPRAPVDGAFKARGLPALERLLFQAHEPPRRPLVAEAPLRLLGPVVGRSEEFNLLPVAEHLDLSLPSEHASPLPPHDPPAEPSAKEWLRQKRQRFFTPPVGFAAFAAAARFSARRRIVSRTRSSRARRSASGSSA